MGDADEAAGGQLGVVTACPLLQLLTQCGVGFDRVRGSSRRTELLKSLAARAGVDCDQQTLALWRSEWDALLHMSQQGPRPGSPARDAAPAPADPAAAAPETPPPAPDASRAGEGRTVFVGGLPSDVADYMLRFRLEEFGAVDTAEVKRDPRTDRSRGFGFVTFTECSSAERAAAAGNFVMRGHTVQVQLAAVQSQVHSGARAPDATQKVFVGGLTQEVDEEQLREFFATQCGRVLTVEIKRDPANGRSRGFGFITFSSPAGAEAATALRRPQIGGRLIEVQRSLARGDPGLVGAARGPDPACRIFVGGLPQRIGDRELRDFFESRFGSVDHAEVKRDLANGRSRGFGFVVFAEAASAHAAQTQRLVLDGREIEVQLTIARGDAALANRQSQRGQRAGAGTSRAADAAVTVGSLPAGVTDAELRSLLGGCGTIVRTDWAQGGRKGRVDVVFSTAAGADAALQLPDPRLRGRAVQIRPRRGRPPAGAVQGHAHAASTAAQVAQQPQRVRLYALGVPGDATESELAAALPALAPGASVQLHRDPSGLVQHGIIECADPQEAALLLSSPFPAVVRGWAIRLSGIPPAADLSPMPSAASFLPGLQGAPVLPQGLVATVLPVGALPISGVVAQPQQLQPTVYGQYGAVGTDPGLVSTACGVQGSAC